MSIQSNFPNLKPSLLLDFANTKQLDNRVTFTRSTPAVYYDGKTTAMAEQNLLVQSQNSLTDWTLSAVTTTTSATTAPDGTSTAISVVPTTASTPEHFIYQSYTGTVNQYTYSVYAKPNGYNWVWLRPQIGGSIIGHASFNVSTGAIGSVSSGITATITSVGNGWYRCTATSTQGTGTNYFGVGVANTDGAPNFAGNGTSGAYLWGAQLEQRSAATAYTATTTQAITNYIPVLLTAGGNQPRFDCNPTTGESLGLLIEEQRTNIATYSSVNTSGWVSVSSTLTNNYATSPDGTTSAGYLADDTNNVQHSLYQTVTLANATSYSFSAYIKSYGRNYAEIIPFGTPTGNTVVGASFNLSNGTVSATTGAVTATITSVGNGWYRCSVIYTTVASGALNFNIFPSIGPNVGDRVYTGNGFSGLLVWGAQAEAGAFATSYIATTSASATRTADLATMTGANFSSWFNNAQGTFVATINSGSISNGARVLKISDSDSNRLIDFYINGVASSQAIYSYQNGITSANYGAGTISTSKYLTAVSYATGNISALVNAGSITTSTSAVVSSVANSTFAIGYDPISNAAQMSRPIAKIAYYPIQVTSANLQALTS